MFFLVVLFIVFRVAIESPKVQNYLVDWATEYLSKELNTKVEVKHVDFSLFNSVLLDSVLIEDTRGDTLLYVEKLEANLRSGFSDLIQQNIDVESLELYDGKFRMYKDTTLLNGNMAFLTEFFGGKKDSLTIIADTIPTTKKPFFLDVEELNLHRMEIENIDKTKGDNIYVQLEKGSLSGINFNSTENKLSLDKLILENFDFFFVKDERQLPPPPDKPDIEKDSSYVYFTADANKIQAINGRFKFQNLTKESKRLKFENTMDFNDLDVEEIEMDIDSFWMREDLWFKGRLVNMEAKEKSGFTLNPSKVDEVEVTEEGLVLYGMELNTPSTVLGDSLEMNYRRNGYPSFNNFVDDVRIKGLFKEGSKISLEDIFTFAPELQNNRFFYNAREEVLQVQGEVSGKINNLKTKGFLMKIGNKLTLKGDMRSRNIAVKGEEFFDFELERLSTDISTIRTLVPDFNPPSRFDKLGKLSFTGRFTGFLTSFTADGFIRTDIGDIRSDISLKGDKNDSEYSGSLDLINFDLAEWTGNPDFGVVNFSSEVKNGSGLRLDDINADLSAEISSFTFRDYTYKLLNIGGKFDKRKFDGNLSIKDDNIDMVFNGLVDFNDSIPEFNFTALVNKLKLEELNLSKKPIDLKAQLDFNFKGLKLEDLDGDASASNVEFTLDTIKISLDSLYAYSFQEDNHFKRIGLRSEILSGEIIGKYEIDELPKIVVSYAQRNFPQFMKKINVNPKLVGFNESRYFDFDFSINNSKNLTTFISPKLDTIFNTSLQGYFDSRKDTLAIDINIEKSKFDDFQFTDINLNGQFIKDDGYLDIGVYRTFKISDSIDIPYIAMWNTFHKDTFDFQFELVDFNQVLDKLNLYGSLTLDGDDFYKITFNSSNLVLLNHKWEILKDNFIRFGKGKIETQNFKMFNLDIPEQIVELNTLNDKGLELSLNGLDINMLNSYINYDRLNLEGPIDIEVETGDVFKLQDLKVEAKMDSLFMNGDYFGELNFAALTPDIKSVVVAGMTLEKGKQKLIAQGNYRPPYLVNDPNYLTLDLDVQNYPLEIAEYFIGNNISGTTGNINADLKLYGPTNQLDLTGKTYVSDVYTTIDYLQTTIHVPTDTIEIRSNIIDLGKLTFYDEEGNWAIATGGITKNGLKDFGLDIQLDSPKFVALNTNEEDNELFYGKAIGDIEATFKGDFANTDMVVDATTLLGTKIFLPISSANSSSSELSFITFKEKDTINDLLNQFIPEELKGLDLELKLHINPEAEIQLVIDENAGDILKGRGTAEYLTINVTRDGEFEMYGTYTVEEGNYLFTLLNVINKPFVIKKGGTITWSGDPLGAKINLEATYDKLSTTPYNFILEYLNDSDEKTDAQRSTPVDLSMDLVGELFSPDISFDISFPNLRGRIKNYTDSKLRIINEDKNELNRQVLGLIAFGSFFPSDMAYSNSGLVDGGINTLSELLSNQLSIYISELLSEVITDVDIDFNYRYYELTDIGDIDELKTGSELEIRLKKGLFNNRLVINAGSNFDIDGGTDNGAFLAGDLLIEYLLTPDGRFKIRFYSESDNTIAGRRIQTGVGFTYRREFDSFSDLFKRTRNKKFNIEKNYDTFKKNLQEAAMKSLNSQ